MNSYPEPPQTPPTGLGGIVGGNPPPLAGSGSGDPIPLGAEAFRLYGRLYLVASGRKLTLADWRKRHPVDPDNLRSFAAWLEGFVTYHLTDRGREMWQEDRADDGPITLLDIWEVAYLLDPDARPVGHSNREIRRKRKRRKR